MIYRAVFFFIAAFWVTMNVLLWRAEYGSHGGEIAVPLDLVRGKILTAPDVSSLNIFKDGRRAGFCEFSTSVEQEMATLDENSPPPEGVLARAGYQIRLDGSVSFDSPTNRLRFDGRLQFSSARDWREASLKFYSRTATVEIHSLATDQNFHIKITGDNINTDTTVRFADLQNPGALLRKLGGNSGGGFLGGFDLPEFPQTTALDQGLQWQAHRERLLVGHEPVSVYRLEAEVLQNKIVVYVSTLGEILRVELPGGITAAIDGWDKL